MLHPVHIMDSIQNTMVYTMIQILNGKKWHKIASEPPYKLSWNTDFTKVSVAMSSSLSMPEPDDTDIQLTFTQLIITPLLLNNMFQFGLMRNSIPRPLQTFFGWVIKKTFLDVY